MQVPNRCAELVIGLRAPVWELEGDKSFRVEDEDCDWRSCRSWLQLVACFSVNPLFISGLTRERLSKNAFDFCPREADSKSGLKHIQISLSRRDYGFMELGLRDDAHLSLIPSNS